MWLRSTTPIVISLWLVLFVSCTGSGDKKADDPGKDTFSAKKIQKGKIKDIANEKKPPIINIVDTVAPKRMIVYMRDSAASSERIGIKLGQIYGVKLTECFKKNALKITGLPMAWFKSQKAPFFFEAGMPVNKRPSRLTKGVNVKELPADSVVVAHFYGPYDLIHVGYEVLYDWMKTHNRSATASPYEIYISDPIDKKGKPVDPYKVQTDIVFPRK